MTSVIRGSDNFETDQLFGFSQTPKNLIVGVDRILGTPYTNSGKRLIMVSIQAAITASVNTVWATVDGVPFAWINANGAATNSQTSATIPVPAGSTLIVNSVAGVVAVKWSELS